MKTRKWSAPWQWTTCALPVTPCSRSGSQKMAKIALAKKDSGDPFYAAKLQTARFYFAKLLPEIESCAITARAGLKPLMETELALA